VKRLRALQPLQTSSYVSSEELAAFIEASRAANEPVDLPTRLDVILSAALRLLGGDEGSIQLLDDGGTTLKIVAAQGIPESVVQTSRVPVGQGISGQVVATGKALLLPSAVDVQRFAGYEEKERQIHGAVCVPLRGRGRTLGVLNVNIMAPGRRFTEHDLHLATLFAENAALAIQNSKLLGDAERYAHELEGLRGASVRLASSLKIEEVGDAALGEALTLADSNAGFLVLAGGVGRALELARYRGLSRSGLRDVISAPGFRTCFERTDAIVVRHVSSDPVFAPLAPDLGNLPLALVPLRSAEGSAGGLLGVALTDGDDPRVLRTVSTFALEAGLALTNAMLYREILTREEELETIVFSVPLPILLVDDRGLFRAINPAAAETFRISPDFELGQPARGKLPQPIEEILLDETDDVLREVILSTDGDPRSFRARASRVSVGKAKGGRVLVLDDVTAERELEQRKADFLAVIGHELRTPLTIIKGFSSTLRRRGHEMDDETRADALERVGVQAERLERLIEDLLYVSRIETARPPLHVAWDDLVEVCTNVIDEFRRRDLSRPISLRTPVPQAPLQMDRTKVEQILYHLIDNALKYSDAGTPVTVELTPADEELRVTVIDGGVGIFSGDLPRLFRAFGQLDSRSTRRHGGTGVGLYVCKTLVDTLGGRIWADSTLGKGSKFSFTIPKVPPIVTPPEAP
jgi:signal transduction histidine kinase/putative methionine-R-sulfoxide reductase with GAF domain